MVPEKLFFAEEARTPPNFAGGAASPPDPIRKKTDGAWPLSIWTSDSRRTAVQRLSGGRWKKTKKAAKASGYGDQKSNKLNKRLKKDRRGKSNFRQNEISSRNQKNDSQTYTKKPSLLKKFEIKIYPQDETFDALIKQLKIDCKTYQLFELTQIILEKPERFVVLINRIENNESSNPIYFCPKDKIPFDTKEEAIEHFYKNFISDFYEITDI